MEDLGQKANPTRRKLKGYEFYREVLGSPRYVVAPMVDQSELVRDITSQLNTAFLSAGWCRLGECYPDDTALRYVIKISRASFFYLLGSSSSHTPP